MAGKPGRPKKRTKRNISGLKNQDIQKPPTPSSPSRSPSPAESLSDYGDMEIPDIAELDSIAYLEVDTDHDDNYNEEDWEEIATEDFNKCLLDMVSQIEEDRQDAGDNDWLPTRERYEAQRKIARRKPGGIYIFLPSNMYKDSQLNRQANRIYQRPRYSK